MNFMFEASDFTDIKLNIYESYASGNITAAERDSLLEAVSNKEINEELMMESVAITLSVILKVAGAAAGAIAMSSAIIGMIVKISNTLKANDKIKASKELTDIKNDMQKCNQRLKALKKEYHTMYSTYFDDWSAAGKRANFYGTKTFVTNDVVYDRDGRPILDKDGRVVKRTSIETNKQYDREKAEKERLRAKEAKEKMGKYEAKIKETKQEIKKMKELKSRFMAVVRNNMGEEEYQNIRAELDKISQAAENSYNQATASDDSAHAHAPNPLNTMAKDDFLLSVLSI